MRGILFRGKRADTGEWIYGDLRQDEDLETTYIGGWDYFTADYALQREPFEYPVSPETVSQFTGLYDKNGVRIWENDIVIIGGNKSFPTVVEFSSGSWQCVRKYTDKGRENEYSYLHRLEYDNPNQYEVIGNVFDNPELLNQ